MTKWQGGSFVSWLNHLEVTVNRHEQQKCARKMSQICLTVHHKFWLDVLTVVERGSSATPTSSTPWNYTINEPRLIRETPSWLICDRLRLKLACYSSWSCLNAHFMFPLFPDIRKSIQKKKKKKKKKISRKNILKM